MKCPMCGNTSEWGFGRTSASGMVNAAYRCSKCETEFEERTGRIIGTATTAGYDQLVAQLDHAMRTISQISQSTQATGGAEQAWGKLLHDFTNAKKTVQSLRAAALDADVAKIAANRTSAATSNKAVQP